ncbi:MAG TPA: PKD domain-containing protein, partial [Longimicrobium sp.]|nr:PKD domain-containing protein [Longimicrobium sp.]
TDATAVPGGGPSESTLVADPDSLSIHSEAFDINGAGMIVGQSWTEGYPVATIWSAAGVTTTLPGLGHGRHDWPNSIDERGRVVGWSLDSAQVFRAVMWTSPSAPPVRLPDFGSTSYAHGINRSGMIVGAAVTPDYRLHAVVWTPDRVLHDIDPGGQESRALAVNDSGKVVGTTWREGKRRAFLWTQATGMQLLPVGGDSSSALAINTRGEVVGSFTERSKPRAFLWSPRTGLSDLGTTGLPGYGHMRIARDINDAGLVVGEFGWYSNAGAAAWTVRSGPRPLEAPNIASAMAVNRHGVAVGNRRGSDNYTYAARWRVTEVNTRPSLAFPAPSITVFEGDTVTLNLTATDAEQDALSYNWNFGDGASLNVPATTAAPAMRRPWSDDGSYTVRVIAIDPSAVRDTATLAVTVLNRPPTANFVSPAYGYEGKTYVLSLSALKDGPADVRAGIQVSFDCGAGYGAWALATRVTCPAVADDDTLQIGVRLRDNDGAMTESRRTFIIYDAQPVVAASAVTSTSVATGILFTARGQFSDPGKQDAPWLVRYFWGDGTYTSTTVNAQGWLPAMSHEYRAPGTYSVTVYVTDKDGRNGKSAPITVTVGS